MNTFGNTSREEYEALREAIRDERKRWEDAVGQRERELEEAAGAVQRAVRSLERQRLEFEQLCRRQSEELEGKQSQLNEQIHSLMVRLEQQEESLAQREIRIAKGLGEMKETDRRLRQRRAQWNRRLEAKTRQLLQLGEELCRLRQAVGNAGHEGGLPAPSHTINGSPSCPDATANGQRTEPAFSIASWRNRRHQDGSSNFSHRASANAPVPAHDDRSSSVRSSKATADSDPRARADQLSFEVCDRLVLHHQAVTRTMRRVIMCLVVAILVASLGGVYVLRWLQML